MNSLRIKYAVAFSLMLVVEVVIALFVSDAFIRPYVGDVLVVVVVYLFIKIWAPSRNILLPAYIFLFALGIELLQYINIVELLGMQDNRFMSVLVGTVFDIKDILCYLVGCIFIFIYEYKFVNTK